MPVRVRITLLFSLLVFIILSMVCTGIYFFSYQARVQTIQTRLTNRAITTATLLSQEEIFDQDLVRRIDSFTTVAMKNKIVQVYDYQNNKIYDYRDVPGDTFTVKPSLLDDARVKGRVYFTLQEKDAIAYHYTDNSVRMVVVTAGYDEDGKESLQRLQNILLLSFLIGNLIVLATGYLFSRSLLMPVKRITQDVAEISAHNLTRRLEAGTTRDEWHDLASTLNDLLNRLQESFELQRRFISNASHELSTPLTSISSQLQVSLQREREAEEYRRVMQSIYQDVQHMSKLTLTLLEFAKTSGSAGGLEISKVRMDEIILGLPAQVAKINPQYSAAITFDNLPEDEEKLLVYGNAPLLEMAIKNIVVNACKYSPDHKARVHLKPDDELISIFVEDKGVGIPKEELNNIFQPFYRVAGNLSTGGFGLGLSLAQRIIKLHKGNITVVSEPNAGTVFTITLPVVGTADL